MLNNVKRQLEHNLQFSHCWTWWLTVVLVGGREGEKVWCLTVGISVVSVSPQLPPRQHPGSASLCARQ